MQTRFKLLATAAVVGSMAIAAVPSTSQADPSFGAVCSALGLPSSTSPISLGALGGITLTTCSSAVLGGNPCPVGTIPVSIPVPGVININGNLCLGL